MGEDASGPRLGLRERKKLMTRVNILRAAQEMFAERGFDHVTVAEIADAVNVSPKTVFVYFPAKEDMVFDGEAEMRERLVERIRSRAPGETPLEAMGRCCASCWPRTTRRPSPGWTGCAASWVTVPC